MTVSSHPLAEVEMDHGTRSAHSPRSLREMIEHAAHLLPAQGPITAFVHHNTLHAFEDFPFDDAVKMGGRLFGCHPYLPEEAYRQLLKRERIRPDDVWAVLLDDLEDGGDVLIGRLGTRFYLRLAMLQYPLRTASSHELQWVVAATDAARRFRPAVPRAVRKRVIEQTRRWVMRDLRPGGVGDHRVAEILTGLLHRFDGSRIEEWSDAAWEAFCLQLLWRVCHQGVHGVPAAARDACAAAHPSGAAARDACAAAHPSGAAAAAPAMLVRHRDLLLEASGEDSDRLVHAVLIRFCAAFLDQGYANWPLPYRELGFYRAFVLNYGRRGGPPDLWLRGLRRELCRLCDSGIGPDESIEESLEILGVEASERETFITDTLLALRGWAGMIWQMETRGDRVAHPAPAGSLVEFLAVRLLLERFALAYVARDALGFRGPLRDLRSEVRPRLRKPAAVSVDQRAFLVFQLAQVLGWKPDELFHLTRQEWSLLVREIEEFSSLERRRVYQLAYERRYRIQTLDAVRAQAARVSPRSGTPRYQVVCCIDEREESFRRHLEEIAASCETLGAAGFFAVAMYYRGAAEAHFTPLCPPVVRPTHYVQEDVVLTFADVHQRRTKTRRMLGRATHRAHVGTRTFTLGAFLAALFGPLASVPLVARILFPRLTAQIRRLFSRIVQTPPVTQLQLERTQPDPGPDNGHRGYTVPEMAGIVERLLRDIGLTNRFSPLVIITGHGSSSLNNPHEAAHDCGACGGARGGPNARAFARMANDSRVRRLVALNGLEIPEHVWFVGAYHNTCDDSIAYFDLDRLPPSHTELFEEARRDLDLARERSAHERCRRFESAPLSLSPEAALRHVEGRSEDLAQTRPEYGHATNSLCFVGRRWRTRGLFLDRRAFLTSYDPLQDDEERTILTRILQAVVPVCAGISLEYYFSFVDSTGYGCGTKLPHNVTSLLGVMDGAASDLRPGLPWQMVEIHEPVRLLFVIETTPSAMLRIMDRDETIGRLCRYDWVQIATHDPHSGEIHVFRGGRFERYEPGGTPLPVVTSSSEWYRGWRDHLGFASVRMSEVGDRKSELDRRSEENDTGGQ